MSQIVIISGPPGAGKSDVAESLCGRYDRTVHLETDRLYEAVRLGFIKPWLPGSGRQNEMVTRAAARAATAYAEEQYAVFIDGAIGPHLLPIYIDEMRCAGVPIHFALLRPTVEETVRRGLTREPTLRVPEAQLRDGHAHFIKWGDFAGETIDSSGLTPDETADFVMDACGKGKTLVYQPE